MEAERGADGKAAGTRANTPLVTGGREKKEEMEKKAKER